MFSPYLKNGIVVQVAAASEFESFEAFQAAIVKLPLSADLGGTPSVRFRTLRNRNLEFTYGSAPRVDGRASGIWKVAAVRRSVPAGGCGFGTIGDDTRVYAENARLQGFARFRLKALK